MAALEPKPDFDWKKLTWGRPSSPPTVLCSYCSAALSDQGVPLILSNQAGWTVRFCDKCMQDWWGFEPIDELQ